MISIEPDVTAEATTTATATATTADTAATSHLPNAEAMMHRVRKPSVHVVGTMIDPNFLTMIGSADAADESPNTKPEVIDTVDPILTKAAFSKWEAAHPPRLVAAAQAIQGALFLASEANVSLSQDGLSDLGLNPPNRPTNTRSFSMQSQSKTAKAGLPSLGEGMSSPPAQIRRASVADELLDYTLKHYTVNKSLTPEVKRQGSRSKVSSSLEHQVPSMTKSTRSLESATPPLPMPSKAVMVRRSSSTKGESPTMGPGGRRHSSMIMSSKVDPGGLSPNTVAARPGNHQLNAGAGAGAGAAPDSGPTRIRKNRGDMVVQTPWEIMNPGTANASLSFKLLDDLLTCMPRGSMAVATVVPDAVQNLRAKPKSVSGNVCSSGEAVLFLPKAGATFAVTEQNVSTLRAVRFSSECTVPEEFKAPK